MYIVLENIRSVYNVGSIFRTMEGFGFTHAVLVGITPTPLDRHGLKRKDFIKTALGAEDRIAWEYFETTQEFVRKNPGLSLISLERTDKSVPLSNLPSVINLTTTALVLGSEVAGVEASTLVISENVYHIDMHGYKESFNVSVAAGIALYVLSNR